MIKITKPIIVEGKYDKITLENVVDALIIPTNGFSIFKNKEKREMIRLLADRDGIIVMTDSDSAGNLIRSHIKNIVGTDKIINVYLPELYGKEKRKQKPSKEGLLGVEGMKEETIVKALERSGITSTKIDKETPSISKTDMFKFGFSGIENSKQNRISFLKYISLPSSLSPNAMLDILNTLYTNNEFETVVSEWKMQTPKN